jgi:peroxin-5
MRCRHPSCFNHCICQTLSPVRVQANIGEYETSIRYYGRALMLNSQAASVWGYLRTSVTCAGRDELLRAVDDEDLNTITTALPL